MLNLTFIQLAETLSPLNTSCKTPKCCFAYDICEFRSDACIFMIILILRCRLTGALATACGDDGVRVFKEDPTADPEQPIFFLTAHVPKAHNQDVNCVSWNPKEAGLLATCSDNGEFAIWKYNSDNWAGEWNLIGQKHWISNAQMASWVITIAVFILSTENVFIDGTGQMKWSPALGWNKAFWCWTY